MAHIARTHASWISALVVVAICASCVTWLCVTRFPQNPRGSIISETFAAHMLRVYRNESLKAQGIFKVDGCQDVHLAWEEECCVSHLFLDRNKTWITVKETGIYLIYVHVTYGLKKGNASVDLQLFVDFNYTGNNEMEKQELAAVFDTRQLTENEQDASLSAFLLLNMKAMEKLSVRAFPKNQIKCADIRPFSSYISIIRYAD
ncbi:uncharacterized protein si:dkey-220k22.3 isoform X2 [Colossoma macropomum]|uniref:uncharacterized protein si:dkey-220k22.3 isoform X2 n=1 Tax=Colossoma macropomum TaxID=42526 RepID=UPI0018646097|nr:uncharacterized protein si:dkey-220k22.3 isoform X2 [Colossoma macropomum]